MKKTQFFVILPAFLFCKSFSIAQNKSNAIQDSVTTYITGKINYEVKSDSLILMLNGPFVGFGGAEEKDASQIMAIKFDNKGGFKFQIKTGNSPFHVTLYLSNSRNTSGHLSDRSSIVNYLVEAGDSIHIVINKEITSFSGKGYRLFEAQTKIREIDPGDKILESDVHKYYRKNKMLWLREKDSLLNTKLQKLADFKSKLSQIAYRIIRADIIGVNRAWIYRRISFDGPFFVAGFPLDKELDNLYQELEHRTAYIDQEDRSALSPEYTRYLYDVIRIEVKYNRIVNNVNPFIDENYFNEISSRYKGILLDKLLTYWLISVSGFNQLHTEYINNALSVMQSPFFIQIVENLKSTFSRGQPVTDFNFRDSNGKTVRLSDFRGKVVLIDLWFSGCTPCLEVAKGLRKVEKAFNNRSDVEFVSISTDKDREIWLRSIDKAKMTEPYSYYVTPATLYLYTSGTGQNNPFIKKYVSQEGYPNLLLIDKKGRIFSSIPTRPITEEARNKLILEINEARKIN